MHIGENSKYSPQYFQKHDTCTNIFNTYMNYSKSSILNSKTHNITKIMYEITIHTLALLIGFSYKTIHDFKGY